MTEETERHHEAIRPSRHQENMAGPWEGPCRGGGLWKCLCLTGNSYKTIIPDSLPQAPKSPLRLHASGTAPPSFQVLVPQTSEPSLTSVSRSHPTSYLPANPIGFRFPVSPFLSFIVATTVVQITDVSCLDCCRYFLTGLPCFCLAWSCHV